SFLAVGAFCCNRGGVHSRFILATPAFASGHCLNRWEAGHGAWPLNSITWPVSRTPPAFLPYLEGTQNRFTARPRSGPGPRGSSPSRATSARPNRHRPLHAHPVHDPCSREGDGEDYAGGFWGVDKPAQLFFVIEQNQWVGGKACPRLRGGKDVAALSSCACHLSAERRRTASVRPPLPPRCGKDAAPPRR